MDATRGPTEGVEGRVKGRGTWWRSSDDELIAGRVSEVKGVFKGLKGPPLDERDVEAAFDEASRDKRYRNLLDMVPVRTGRYGRRGRFLMVPVFKSEWGRKLSSLLGLRQERRIRLDRFGWGVWDLCDGSRDVSLIGDELRVRFGERVEPLYPRLTKFLAYLVHLDLVKLKGPIERR